MPAQVLRDIRGIEDVEEEFGDIRAACQRAALVTNPWRTICRPAYRAAAVHRHYRHPLPAVDRWELVPTPCVHA